MKPITLTISSGRSGTFLLSRLFAQVPNNFSEHEREPSFSSVRQANILNPEIGKKFVKEHLNYIQQLPGKTYTNTDQSVSKGCLEYFYDFGIIPTIVILRRNPRKIASSLFQLNWIPGKHPGYMCWFNIPNEPNVLPFANWEKAHTYQLCFWYACECEKRAQYYYNYAKEKGSLCWETNIDKILDVNHFNDMLNFFSLPTVTSLPQEKVNTYETVKNKELPPPDLLRKLELDVLDRIPIDFKNNLIARGWDQL
jgi:hypothetical protein